jgi:hypothetical protein
LWLWPCGCCGKTVVWYHIDEIHGQISGQFLESSHLGWDFDSDLPGRYGLRSPSQPKGY